MVYEVCLKYKKFTCIDLDSGSNEILCAGPKDSTYNLYPEGNFKLPIHLPVFKDAIIYNFHKPEYLEKEQRGIKYHKLIDGIPYRVQLGANFEHDGIYYLIRADMSPTEDNIKNFGIEKKAEMEIDFEYFHSAIKNYPYEGIMVKGFTIEYAYRESHLTSATSIPIPWRVFKETGIDKFHKARLFTIVYVPENHIMFKIDLNHLTTVSSYEKNHKIFDNWLPGLLELI